MKQVSITLILLVCSLAATADTLKGVVQNSTTNKPSVGDDVTLKKIGKGMEDVAKTKTNARGEFSFNVPAAQQPYIVWVQHQGVTYTQAGLPGGVPVAIRVFDAAASIKEITILDHAMALQTSEDGATLNGEEFYTSRQSIDSAANPYRPAHIRILSARRRFHYRIQRSNRQDAVKGRGDPKRRKEQIYLRFSHTSGTNSIPRPVYSSLLRQAGNRSSI